MSTFDSHIENVTPKYDQTYVASFKTETIFWTFKHLYIGLLYTEFEGAGEKMMHIHITHTRKRHWYENPWSGGI